MGEIKEVLAFSDRGEAPCMHVAKLMEERIRTLSEHIRGLDQLRGQLERLVEKAKTLPSPQSGARKPSSRAGSGGWSTGPSWSIRMPSGEVRHACHSSMGEGQSGEGIQDEVQPATMLRSRLIIQT